MFVKMLQSNFRNFIHYTKEVPSLKAINIIDFAANT
jgi:hypothetical protein